MMTEDFLAYDCVMHCRFSDGNSYEGSFIMTAGTNMGVKSLSRYLNQYKAASEESKYITRKIIKLEEKLARDLREFL